MKAIDRKAHHISVFTLELPQKIHRAVPMGGDYLGNADRTKREGPSFTAPDACILAVDDNTENLQVFRFLLKRTLVQVDTVTSGADCLKAVRKKTYHAIFMDYMMPGMDGIETFRRLRAFEAECRRRNSESPKGIPVLALTADALRGTGQRFLDEGFSAYLTKPVIWRDLENCLLEQLPPELIVTRQAGEAPPNMQTGQGREIAEKTRNDLARDLAAWGVLLDEGQRYLAPDTGLLQYKRFAEIFTENYGEARKEAEKLAAQKDWQALSFSVHSLKSKARAIGAEELHITAAGLEKYCTLDDGAYIATAMPLLLLEWERACRGLEQFIARMDALSGAGESTNMADIKIGEVRIWWVSVLFWFWREPEKGDFFILLNRFKFGMVAGDKGRGKFFCNSTGNTVSQGYGVANFQSAGIPQFFRRKGIYNFNRGIDKALKNTFGIIPTLGPASVIVNLKKLNTGNIHFGIAGIRLSNYLRNFISPFFFIRPFGPFADKKDLLRRHSASHVIKKGDKSARINNEFHGYCPERRLSCSNSSALSARFRSRYAVIVSSPLHEPRNSNKGITGDSV